MKLKIVIITILFLVVIQNASAEEFQGYFTETEVPKGLIENSQGWFTYKRFLLGQNISYWAIHLIQPKTAQAEELPLKKRIENWIRHTSDKYGLHYGIFRDVLYCESRLNPKAVGDWRSETKEFMARGVAQFWRRTFEKFKVESKMPELEYENWQDQISLMGWAFSNDLAHHWYNCHKAVRIKYK